MLPAQIAGARSRVVSAGVDPAQYDAVTSRLASLREWPEAFAATAAGHLARGERAEAAGRLVTAGEAYRDAALWFHFATILPTAVARAHERAAGAMCRALGLLDPAAEHIGGARFRAVLRRPAGVERPPVVLVIAGMDSSKVEFHSIAEALLRRGMATYALDGPGQGELAVACAPEPDFHEVAAAAIDALDGRADLDLSRLGAIALSLGGFYGAVTLAHLPRVRAGVIVSCPYALSFDDLPPFVTETLALRTGSRDAARAFADRVRLDGVAARIRQPLRVVDGGRDVIPGVAGGARIAREAPRGEYLLVEEGEHLVGNARWAWLPDTADWIVAAVS
ncbi:alpha/beta hydrolase [Planosporangium thailandense]|uniref:Alpha/beta hydrolase n=1 Tax=Planosporangium thailandense TaxID=765197 RepID=A0ABX0XYL0_9ACTN|nr:alpha/beta hydrolase [Planosporangium thailandense]